MSIDARNLPPAVLAAASDYATGGAHRLSYMVAALGNEFVKAADLDNPIWERLSEQYAASEWLLPERDEDGRLTRAFIEGEIRCALQTLEDFAALITEVAHACKR